MQINSHKKKKKMQINKVLLHQQFVKMLLKKICEYNITFKRINDFVKMGQKCNFSVHLA